MKIKSVSFLILWGFIHQLHAQDLVETYQLALENDPVLKQAYFTQFSVAESKTQSIAQMLPSISVSGNTKPSPIRNESENIPVF